MHWQATDSIEQIQDTLLHVDLSDDAVDAVSDQEWLSVFGDLSTIDDVDRLQLDDEDVAFLMGDCAGSSKEVAQQVSQRSRSKRLRRVRVRPCSS